MKVFISWSGQVSKKLAEAFRQWLPSVIQVVKPYYSQDDISKGSRWANEISKELDLSKIGIICLTKENLEAPWIMFEAGAISKNIDKAKVCPILFDVDPSDIKGPLVQFQAAKFSMDEIRRMLNMINKELGDGGLAADVLDGVLEMWWPKLKDNVDKILKETTIDNKKTHRDQRDILEEILELTRRASITRNRQGRETAVPSGAIHDLVYGYANITTALESLSGLLNVIAVREALQELEKPISYIMRHAELPEFEQVKYRELFEITQRKISQVYEDTLIENKMELPKAESKKQPNK